MSHTDLQIRPTARRFWLQPCGTAVWRTGPASPPAGPVWPDPQTSGETNPPHRCKTWGRRPEPDPALALREYRNNTWALKQCESCRDTKPQSQNADFNIPLKSREKPDQWWSTRGQESLGAFGSFKGEQDGFKKAKPALK